MKTRAKMKNILRLFTAAFMPILSFLALSACSGGGGNGQAVLTLQDTTAPVTAALPGGGAYGEVQYVTLASNETATIYCSLNGTDPVQGALNTVSGPSPMFWLRIGEGTTVLKFFAIDAKGNQEPVKTATYVVTIPPLPPPLANAGPDQVVVRGSLVTLDGSGSSTANGINPSYRWSLTSMPAGSSATLSSLTAVNPTFTADLDGSYVVSLVVNDGQMDSVPNTVVIKAARYAFTFDDGTLQGWTTNGSWGLTGAYAHSGIFSVTDSPGGNYFNNSNTALISPVLDLTGTASPVLMFYHLYLIESGYDYGMVEISTDGGATFGPAVRSYTGSLSSFTLVTVDLSPYKNFSQVVIRFRLTSDTIYTYDGWYIDDIMISP